VNAIAVFPVGHLLPIPVLTCQGASVRPVLSYSKGVQALACLQLWHPDIRVSSTVQKIRFLFGLCHNIKAAIVHRVARPFV
jgi:hypothetical protein